MAVVRTTLEQIKASRPTLDRAKIEATTEEDIRRYQIEDGYDPDAALPPSEDWSPDVASLRWRLKMTQEALASAIGVPVATVRNWEQHRTRPDPAARSLLIILSREPEAALRALAAGP